MALPYKWNPVTIKVRQLQISSAYQDPDFSEPASPITFGDEILMEAQVNMMSRNFEGLLRSLTGDKENSNGHLVFRNPIADTSGNLVGLQKGDKITEMAGVATDLFITEARPESPLNGTFLLWYVRFTQNQETRTSN